jgi:glycine/D-amino acid oxidase-like deaminating enzyme
VARANELEAQVPETTPTRRSYRDVSYWMDTVPGELERRPGLGGDLDVDVAIVGAGYTGLWTAWYLTELDPRLRIAILEREIAGFGASGRNGGWCSALFAASHDQVAREAGRDGAIALQRALIDAVDEVGRVCTSEGIDAQFAKGGTLVAATQPAHVKRLQAAIEAARRFGLAAEDLRWLDQAEADAEVRVEGALGATYTPHCASIHPARLARGLAEAVERRGVTIYEGTEVTAIENRALKTAAGRVTAGVVVRATEGYTAQLPGHHRAYLPIYSLMIATEPLPESFWAEVGWARRQTVADGRHVIVYAQRTADDRIAFGGRGAPYHLGSRIEPEFDREPKVFADLKHTLTELFPATADAKVSHTWGGPLAAPRDWFSSVGFDRRTGFAFAGGYVGDGVGTSNLAGRTLADLITGTDSDRVKLPIAAHRSRDWEPEPLRWLGVNAGFHLAASADRSEARTGRPARRGDLLDRLLGH